MKIIISFFLLGSLTSCLMKKEDTLPKPNAPLSRISRGFFSVKKQLYFSDGIDLYCGFKDWEHIDSLTKGLSEEEKRAIILKDEPEMMKFVLHCSKGIIKGTHSTKKALQRK